MGKIYLHPLPVRIWHWINAISFLLLIVTGLQIRYSGVLNLMSFTTAVDVHNIFGFIMSGNFLIWLFYHVLSTKIDIYMPANIRQHNEGSIRQALHYAYGIFRGEQNPHHPSIDRKFNSLQQIAYLNIMTLLIPIQILTGFMLWDAKFFLKWIVFLGGIRIIDSVHMLLFLFFSSFLFVHIYLATLGSTPFAHTKAMITGYEEAAEAEGEHAYDLELKGEQECQ